MPSLSKMRVGIFGGAFDPPHRGHERALRAFLTEAQLDLVYVIPSGRAPHKQLSGGASNEDRLAMARLAFEGLDPRVTVSDLEIASEELSFTYLTVRALREKHSEADLFLFIGTDQLLSFESWRNVPELLSRCTLCIMDRFADSPDLSAAAERLKKEFGARFLLLREKAYIISSTAVRDALERDGVSFDLAPAVHDYITLRGLYHKVPDRTAEVLSFIEKSLPAERLGHSLSVARETLRLCRVAGEEREEALYQAALLHDLTRRKSTEEQRELLSRFGESLSPEDERCPAALHGRTAALLAREAFDLDPYVADAIACHTTGRERMTLADEILFFADYIEETRVHKACREAAQRFYGSLPEDPAAARRHLSLSVTETLQNILSHLEEEGRPIHSESRRSLAARMEQTKGIFMTPIEKAKKIASVLDEKKGRDVQILQVTEQTVLCDFFVIATATSSTHLKALCDEVEYRLREEDGITAYRTEGYQSTGWILADFGDVIVHLFDAASRDFFKLEKLWQEGTPVPFDKKED